MARQFLQHSCYTPQLTVFYISLSGVYIKLDSSSSHQANHKAQIGKKKTLAGVLNLIHQLHKDKYKNSNNISVR
jgi:hypothetical protein